MFVRMQTVLSCRILEFEDNSQFEGVLNTEQHKWAGARTLSLYFVF